MVSSRSLNRAARWRGSRLGPRRSEHDALDAAVDPMKGEIEPPRSRAFARQAKHEILGEPLGRAREIGGIGDRLGKAQPHAARPAPRRAATMARADHQAPDRDAAPPCRRTGWRGRRAASHKDRRSASDPPAGFPGRWPGRGAALRPAMRRGRRACSPAAESLTLSPIGAKRANAQAAPSVSATAIWQAMPWRSSRAVRSAASAASPPHRCAEPVISTRTPSAPSGAVHGL